MISNNPSTSAYDDHNPGFRICITTQLGWASLRISGCCLSVTGSRRLEDDLWVYPCITWCWCTVDYHLKLMLTQTFLNLSFTVHQYQVTWTPRKQRGLQRYALFMFKVIHHLALVMNDSSLHLVIGANVENCFINLLPPSYLFLFWFTVSQQT